MENAPLDTIILCGEGDDHPGVCLLPQGHGTTGHDCIPRGVVRAGISSGQAMKPARLEFYKDAEFFWRWRIVGANGRIVGASSEGFAQRYNAKRNANLVCDVLLDQLAAPK